MTRVTTTSSKAPGELEQQVLLALAGCEGEASGADVYEALVERTGRELSLPAVYITLDRARAKGWANVRAQEPAPGRGGKPRKFYSLSPAGAALLERMREQFDRLWDAAAHHPLIDHGGAGRR